LETETAADALFFLLLSFLLLLIPLSRRNLRSLPLSGNNRDQTESVQNGLYSWLINLFRNLTQAHKITAIRNYAKTLQRDSLHTVVACS